MDRKWVWFFTSISLKKKIRCFFPELNWCQHLDYVVNIYGSSECMRDVFNNVKITYNTNPNMQSDFLTWRRIQINNLYQKYILHYFVFFQPSYPILFSFYFYLYFHPFIKFCSSSFWFLFGIYLQFTQIFSSFSAYSRIIKSPAVVSLGDYANRIIK